ncbi:MAG: GldM family protein [Crocinitomicaceae bacterium]|nr:GldM family protein [Crocinitomicaceae bacterium]
MAGGKETPRQKMIGMMYLVLTALLALNVSKSILDAFVAIEDNTQKSNIMNHDRGQGFIMDLRSELASTKDDAENAAKREKIKFYLKQMTEVDVETAKMIKHIDDIKLDILKKSGEETDFTPANKNNNEKIIWSKYDAKNYPVLPIRMNLMAVQAKDQYDVPMHEIIGEDLKNPTGSGKKLWADFNGYRSKLVEILGTYKLGDKSFSIKPIKINDFKDNKDLTDKVTKMVKSSKANLQEDENALIQIYMSLTKLEKEEVNQIKGVHWIGKTFDHSPLVAAIASLSSMQQDILSARASALAHLKGKISTGEYSFNKVMALAYGPAIANGGEDVELKVMMAAFDSDNQPKVTSSSGEITVDGGQGIVKIKTSGSGEMKISGTVAIKKKSGDTKTEDWSHTIKIMKPEGTVTLPEMNVLYRGYSNIVTGVASGYDQTILAGTNVSLAKSGNQWIASPGAGNSAKISVSGKNSVTGKTANLGSFDFRIKNLPKPSIFVGTTGDGGKISSNPGGLNAGYPEEITLNAKFSVMSWEATVSGIMGKATGNGSSLAGVNKILGQAKSGSTVAIEAQVRFPNGKVTTVFGNYKLN